MSRPRLKNVILPMFLKRWNIATGTSAVLKSANAVIPLFSIDATKIPSYLASGFLAEQYYYLMPILFGIALGGSYVCRKIIGKINQAKFKKVVLIAVMLASIKFIVDDMVEFQL